MPRLFEVFGYPLSDSGAKARKSRQTANCPFMDRPCDGGGNRYLSSIDLSTKRELRQFFPKREKVMSGVCSIQVASGTAPWIVCPRRLLVLGRESAGERAHQRESEKRVLGLLGYPPGTRLGVWPEVKLKYVEDRGEKTGLFDYTFDYILMPLADCPVDEIPGASKVDREKVAALAAIGGYVVERRSGRNVVRDAPTGSPSVVEIMTSSTSGGNQRNRTTIPQAFEDAILGRPHSAPGINYRQVWARMVSQLIVKSEVALAWGGKCVWVVQDVLVDYIAKSTGLRLDTFLASALTADDTSEVNLLSFSYSDRFENTPGVIDLTNERLYAGPISIKRYERGQEPAFQDIVRAPFAPPLPALMGTLLKRVPANQVVMPGG